MEPGTRCVSLKLHSRDDNLLQVTLFLHNLALHLGLQVCARSWVSGVSVTVLDVRSS